MLTVLFDDNYDNAQQAALARQRVFIVDSVGEALNSDGNLARLIEGMENKKRAAYTSEERYIKNYSTGKEINVHKGDVLQVMLNAMGDIRSVRRLYDAEKNSYDAVSYSVATDNNTRMTIGNVFSTKNNSFSLTEISKPKTWEYAETFVCGGDFYVYVYDKATDKVSAGSYNDITADESTQVVVFASTMTYLDVVVYK